MKGIPRLAGMLGVAATLAWFALAGSPLGRHDSRQPVAGAEHEDALTRTAGSEASATDCAPPAAEDPVGALLSRLRSDIDSNDENQVRTATELCHLAPESAEVTNALIDFARNTKSATARILVVGMLPERRGTAASFDYLRGLLCDASQPVGARTTAAFALASLHPDRAPAVLREKSSRDGDAAVEATVEHILRGMDGRCSQPIGGCCKPDSR